MNLSECMLYFLMLLIVGFGTISVVRTSQIKQELEIIKIEIKQLYNEINS